MFHRLKLSGSQICLEHFRPQPRILRRINGNWLFPRCGIGDTVINGRPGQLVFHTIRSYLIVEAHNNGIITIMGRYPYKMWQVSVQYDFFLFQLPVQCWCNYLNCTNVTTSHKSHDSDKNTHWYTRNWS